MRGEEPRGGRFRLKALAVMVAAGAALALGPAVGSADGPEIWITPTGDPGVVEVHGTGWAGDAGIWLWQCADTVMSDDEYWAACDRSTGVEVTVDSPWDPVPRFSVIPVVDPPAQDPFPDGTSNQMGNGTQDCEAAGAHCAIVAIQGSAYRSAFLGFAPAYGPVGIEAAGATTDLTDGAKLTVTSSGHRPGTEAMTYLCPGGLLAAYPGACDPIAGSLGPVDGVGTYTKVVSVPRFVWDNSPLGDARWFDCAAGCSLWVFSADNLGSEVGVPVSFRPVPVEQHPQLLTVEKVFVNRLGGITIEGRIDCSQAMVAWGQDEFPAGVNVSWTARQPVGRKSVVTAHYDSAMQSMCHNPPATGPFRWVTMPPITTSDPEIWWVYPSAGVKFGAGAIHVDLQVTGTPWAGWGTENYILTGVRQWDGKAVRR